MARTPGQSIAALGEKWLAYKMFEREQAEKRAREAASRSDKIAAEERSWQHQKDWANWQRKQEQEETEAMRAQYGGYVDALQESRDQLTALLAEPDMLITRGEATELELEAREIFPDSDDDFERQNHIKNRKKELVEERKESLRAQISNIDAQMKPLISMGVMPSTWSRAGLETEEEDLPGSGEFRFLPERDEEDDEKKEAAPPPSVAELEKALAGVSPSAPDYGGAYGFGRTGAEIAKDLPRYAAWPVTALTDLVRRGGHLSSDAGRGFMGAPPAQREPFVPAYEQLRQRGALLGDIGYDAWERFVGR